MTFEGTLDVNRGNHIFVNIPITFPARAGFRETKHDFIGLVDTGATITCICQDFVQKNRISIAGEGTTNTASGANHPVTYHIGIFKERQIVLQSCNTDNGYHDCLIGMDLIKELHIKDDTYKVTLR